VGSDSDRARSDPTGSQRSASVRRSSPPALLRLVIREPGEHGHSGDLHWFPKRHRAIPPQRETEQRQAARVVPYAVRHDVRFRRRHEPFVGNDNSDHQPTNRGGAVGYAGKRDPIEVLIHRSAFTPPWTFFSAAAPRRTRLGARRDERPCTPLPADIRSRLARRVGQLFRDRRLTARGGWADAYRYLSCTEARSGP
jgi:hypothetical protein